MTDKMHLELSHVVYGRKREIEIIQDTVSSVDSSNRRAIFFSGSSGIGKTSTVKKAISSFSTSEISFLNGKFDQLSGDSLGKALLRAISVFFVEVLSAPENVLKSWEAELKDHLGQNARVIADVIPELVTILGELEEPAELGPSESQVRFELMLTNLIQFISNRSKKKIVMFVDDLQWASARSIGLIHRILNLEDLNNFIFIGAFRDDVTSDHPLHELLNTDSKKFNLHKIEPINGEDIDCLLNDSFGKNSFNSDLSKCLIEKTAGNPFHVLQFIKYAKLENILTQVDGTWTCDLEKLSKQSISDNVVDILLNEMKLLNLDLQKFLSVCSILGNDISMPLLLNVFESSRSRLSSFVEKMTSLSYINTFDDKINFSHDRIQEAAYELMDEENRALLHKSVGEHLLNSFNSGNYEDITEIANHFNISLELHSEEELIELAELNYKASIQSKNSTAFNQSLVYLDMADRLKELIRNDYSLYSNIILEKSESLYLNSKYDDSESYILCHLEEDLNPSTKALLLNQLVIQCTAQGRYADAISTGRRALSFLGVSLPEDNLEESVEKELKTVTQMVHGREITSLKNIEEMSDHKMKIVMSILINMDSPCYLSNISLYCIVVAKMVQTSIKYGSVAESAKGYASYGIVLCSFNEHELGRKFCELGILIAEQYDHLGQICRACHTMANHVQFWTQHISEGDQYNDRGFAAGHDAGEYLWAGFIKLFKPYNQFFRARNLNELKADIITGIEYCTKHPNQLGVDTLTGLAILVNELGNHEIIGNEISIPTHDEFVSSCHESNSLMALSMYLSVKTFSLILGNKFSGATSIIDESIDLLPYSYSVSTNFYDDFCKAFLILINSKDDKSLSSTLFYEKLTVIEELSISCPENFEPFQLLLLGELSILQGDFYQGVEYLEKSAEAARLSSFYHIKGFVYNRLSFHWQKVQAKSEISAFYRDSSLRVFSEWGAKALSLDYTDNISKRPIDEDLSFNLGVILSSGKNLDDKIDREELVNKSLSILLKTSACDTAYFFSCLNNQSLKKIFHLGEDVENLQPLVNYVYRTKTVLCTNNLDHSRLVEVHGETSYGVLCYPVSTNSVLILINTKSKNHFNSENFKTINLLVQQLEMSLDNIEMYEKLTLFNNELEKQVALRTRELKNERDKAQAIANELKMAQREIVDIAKDAGRAEVAANVLHNVGNSSMYLLGQFEVMKRSLKSESSLEVLNALISKIDNYEGTFSEFTERDPVGKRMLEFLKEMRGLSDEFIDDQTERVTKIEDKLRMMMKMIREENKNIHGFALLEKSDFGLLIEEASTFTSLSESVKHLVKIEIDGQPKIDFEKVKNILINLYSNSLKACRKIDRNAQVNTLVKLRGNKIIIEVSDNGVGMTEATLGSIFSAGFSTSDKHSGYGLHNSSIVAQGLGGSLTGKSDGPQMGATFVLELPYVV